MTIVRTPPVEPEGISLLHTASSLITPSFAVTHLYSLEPLGIGTGMIESLSSYITRLAGAHCVTPGKLFYGLRDLLKNSSSNSTHGAPCNRLPFTLSISGCGEVAERVVNTMQVLTGQPNLRLLTLLDWRRALSPRKLIRKTQAWCPYCYEEWRRSGKPLYQPLLWSIEVVTTCDVHRRPLQVCCPHCRKQFHGRQTKPGYCSRCGAWLGKSWRPHTQRSQTSVLTADNPEHLRQLKALLATTGDRFYQRALSSDLRTVVMNSRWPNATALSHAAGLMPLCLFSFLDAKCRPQLPQLLAICSAAQISLLELLSQQFKMVAIPDSDKCWGRYQPITPALRKKTALALAAALTNQPPVSPERVAMDTKVSPSWLVRTFPDEVTALRAKVRQYRKTKIARMERMLTSALKSPHPIAINVLASKIGFARVNISRCYPELYRKVWERYRDSKPQRSTDRKQKRTNDIRRAAIALYERGEYPSLSKVVRELGGRNTWYLNKLLGKVLAEVRSELGIPTAKFGK